MRQGFTQHTLETAPEASKSLLRSLMEKYQMIANIAAVMAESPVMANAYEQIAKATDEHATLTPVEREIIHMTVSADNGCNYCMAAHSTLGVMFEVDEETRTALRNDTALPNEKLEALRIFAHKLNARQGVSDAEIVAFLSAGFTRAQIFEVITAIALKTLTNLTNHVALTDLDEAFKPQVWEKAT